MLKSIAIALASIRSSKHSQHCLGHLFPLPLRIVQVGLEGALSVEPVMGYPPVNCPII